MGQLTELYLQHNAVTDLTVVGSLSNLSVLDVSYNALNSIAPLSGSIRLTKLNAANNQISDVSTASSLPCPFWRSCSWTTTACPTFPAYPAAPT